MQFTFQNRRMKWKKEHQLPNTKNRVRDDDDDVGSPSMMDDPLGGSSSPLSGSDNTSPELKQEVLQT